ncbi:MAG: chemotaxis protein CheW [Methylobacterium sp.]
MSETERHRALLDERSAALAGRGNTERRNGARREFLVCAVGAEHYGFPLAATAAVMPERACTPVPGAPPALRGIVSHAGIIVSVIDLAEAVGTRGEGADAGHGHFLRLRADDPPVALAVDRVIGLASVEADAIEATPRTDGRDGLGDAAISGYAPAGSDRGGGVSDGFAILDLQRLLRPFLS